MKFVIRATRDEKDPLSVVINLIGRKQEDSEIRGTKTLLKISSNIQNLTNPRRIRRLSYYSCEPASRARAKKTIIIKKSVSHNDVLHKKTATGIIRPRYSLRKSSSQSTISRPPSPLLNYCSPRCNNTDFFISHQKVVQNFKKSASHFLINERSQSHKQRRGGPAARSQTQRTGGIGDRHQHEA